MATANGPDRESESGGHGGGCWDRGIVADKPRAWGGRVSSADYPQVCVCRKQNRQGVVNYRTGCNHGGWDGPDKRNAQHSLNFPVCGAVRVQCYFVAAGTDGLAQHGVTARRQ